LLHQISVSFSGLFEKKVEEATMGDIVEDIIAEPEDPGYLASARLLMESYFHAGFEHIHNSAECRMIKRNCNVIFSI